MDFLTLDQIFVLDNLYFVLDKKSFVQADGPGISSKFPGVYICPRFWNLSRPPKKLFPRSKMKSMENYWFFATFTISL